MKKVFLIFFFCVLTNGFLFAQIKDSLLVKKDSIVTPILQQTAYQKLTQNLFKNNSSINLSKPTSITIISTKKNSNVEFIFYLLAGLVLVLGCLKAFFGKYFNTLFSVFFNTSLRQSQLTDQLLQAKLPSLFFNVFFTISGGIYVYFLLIYFNTIYYIHSYRLSCCSVFFRFGEHRHCRKY